MSWHKTTVFLTCYSSKSENQSLKLLTFSNKVIPQTWHQQANKGILSPAQQNHHRVSLSRNKAKEKDVTTSAVVTFQDGLSQRSIFVESHLFALRSHKMINDVAGTREDGCFGKLMGKPHVLLT